MGISKPNRGKGEIPVGGNADCWEVEGGKEKISVSGWVSGTKRLGKYKKKGLRGGYVLNNRATTFGDINSPREKRKVTDRKDPCERRTHKEDKGKG